MLCRCLSPVRAPIGPGWSSSHCSVSKNTKVILLLVLTAAALATTVYVTRWRDTSSGGGANAGRHGRPGADQAVSVRLATARLGSIDLVLNALGTVTARNTAVVHSRVDGLLQNIRFQEGREVKAGEVLAEIDPRPFEATLQQVEGQLARDRALLEIAKSDLERYQTLLAQDSIAKQQVDDQASLVHQYAGAVESDQGAVASARLQRDFTRITAPFTGRVGLRQVDVGNMVHATDVNGVVVLTETRPINVVFAVPADRAPAIQRRWSAGAALKVEAYDRDGKTLLATGRLESADNQIDPTTSTVKLKALFDNTDGALFPNQFINARLTLATLDRQVLLPVAAVQHGTQGDYVYLLRDDSTVSLRKVTAGTVNGETVAVANGLKAGDRVVVEGTDKLRDGAQVRPAVDAPTGAGAPAKKGPRPDGQPRSRDHGKGSDAGGH